MKETGFIRKVDGLGRIVIPKEIRRCLNIKEDDYLELLSNNDSLIIKKYSKMNKYANICQILIDIINKKLNANIVVTDKYSVVAYSGNENNNILNRTIDSEVLKSIYRRENIVEKYIKKINIVGDIIECSYISNTIVSNGEDIGITYLYREDKEIDDNDIYHVKLINMFISKYLEE